MSTQIRSMRVNTIEEGDDVDNIQIVSEPKSRRKCLIVMGCGIILLLALTTSILALLLFCQTQNATNTTNEQAVDILTGLTNNGNFTDSDLDSFDAAFNVFDTDNDQFLNETEFGVYFATEGSVSQTYGVIDADNDTILSYPEVVAYLSEMIKEEYLFETYFKHNVIPNVQRRYNYTYTDSDPLFIEYAAMLFYFDTFDKDSNGYIRYDEYVSIAVHDDFDFADENSDGRLSKAEFFNVLYGNDDHSFSGAFESLFENGSDKDKFMQSLNNIALTVEQVSNVQISLCPIASSNDAQRRQLQSNDDCGCKVVVVVVIIRK